MVFYTNCIMCKRQCYVSEAMCCKCMSYFWKLFFQLKLKLTVSLL